MIDSRLYKAARRLGLKTKRRLGDNWSGLAASSFRGRGLEFEEVSPYQPGDEIRDIDWKVTARTGRPFVKRFREEKRRTIWLVVDAAPRMHWGSGSSTKFDAVLEVVGVVALAAAAHTDRVGLLTVGANAELVVAPGGGDRHALRLLRELLVLRDQETTRPSIRSWWRALLNVDHRPTRACRGDRQNYQRIGSALRGRRSLVCVISDFLIADTGSSVRRLARKHELVAVAVNDPWEHSIPSMGPARFRDVDTGRTRVVDTSSARFQRSFRTSVERRLRRLRSDLGPRARLLSLRSDRAVSDLLRQWASE